jgi:hypothetical protein
MLNHQLPWLVFLVSSRIDNFQKLYRINDLQACHQSDSDLLLLASQIDPEVDDLGPDEHGISYYNNVGYLRLLITMHMIHKHKMSLQGQFPSDDPEKCIQFFEAGFSLVAVKWKMGIDQDNHVMCNCLTYWNLTSCPHAYHYRYGSPKLSKTKKAKCFKHPLKCVQIGGTFPFSSTKHLFISTGVKYVTTIVL